jgi:hypothetical protein
MCVGENDTTRSEAVHVWRGDLSLRIQDPHIAVAQIICEDVNDVGFWRGIRKTCGECREAKGVDESGV